MGKNILLEMSQVVYPVKITTSDQSWYFSGEDAKGLSANSGLIRGFQEEYEQMQNDPSELIEIEITGQQFESSHVSDAFKYLQDSNWQPEAPKKVTSNKLEDLGLSDAGLALLQKYDHESIFGVFSVGEYLKIDFVKRIARVRVAMEVWMDPTDPNALSQVRQKVGLEQDYDAEIENQLKQDYAFLDNKAD